MINPRLGGLRLLCLGLTLFSSQVYALDKSGSCAINPKFIVTGRMLQPVAIDTQQSMFPGVVVRELKGPKRTFRHPTWDQSGHVGATTRDPQGNIFAVPVPSIGLDTNPLEKRTTIYRIDSVSAEMAPFVVLPMQGSAEQSNPFGTMDIFYDCDNHHLYVSNLANSSRTEERGEIYQLNPESGEIVSRWSGVDALGIATHTNANGKRLYFGEARSSSVLSLPLSNSGQLIEGAKPRYEFSLLEIKNGNSTQVRKIRFEESEQGLAKMVVTDTEFSYRLIADTSKRFRHYEFLWDGQSQQWKFSKIK